MTEVLFYAIIYAFAGWVIEVCFYAYKTRTFVNRGFLHGPFVPIYGLSMIGLHLLIAHFIPNFSFSVEHLLFTALLIVVISTVLELIGGAFLHQTFGVRWWDYSSEKFHYKGYISLKYSIIWGVLGTLGFMFHIQIIVPFTQSINTVILYSITMTFALYLLVDMVFTLKALIGFKALIQEFKVRTQRFDGVSEKLKSKVPESLRVSLNSFKYAVKNNETFAHVTERLNNLKNKVPSVKDNSILKEYSALQKLTNKLTKTRLYRAFPGIKISLRRKKKSDDYDKKS